MDRVAISATYIGQDKSCSKSSNKLITTSRSISSRLGWGDGGGVFGDFGDLEDDNEGEAWTSSAPVDETFRRRLTGLGLNDL